MRLYSLAVAALCLTAAPALAGDDDYGAYLFKGGCDAFAPDLVVKDVGDLDIEKDPAKEWARLAPDNATAPDPVRLEDESTSKVTVDEITAGGYAIAVTDADDPTARVIACGEIPQDAALPFVGELAEVDGSGTEGRIAIEEHKKGVKITTAAYAKDAVPPLAD